MKKIDLKVLAVGKYQNGILTFTFEENGKVNTKEIHKEVKEVATMNKVEPIIPVPASIHNSLDVPDFMKERSRRKQQEQQRKEKGLFGAFVQNLLSETI